MDFKDDEEIVQSFVSETIDHLDNIENGILKLENNQESIDFNLIHSMFRAAHSIKAGANLLKFRNIEALAHALENVLQKLRLAGLVAGEEMVTTLLQTIDTIRDLVNNLHMSDLANVSFLIDKLNRHEGGL